MGKEKQELFVLYQIGASEDWVWFSPIGVFMTEEELRKFARRKGAPKAMPLREPGPKNDVVLDDPQDFVAVKAEAGGLPDVELSLRAQDRAGERRRSPRESLK